jgi:pimeloyl-ACP methyl ester carboxylesterase
VRRTGLAGDDAERFSIGRRPVLRAAVAGVVVLAAVALLGPRARVTGDVASVEPTWDLDAWVRAREAEVAGIRPGDQKEILWADPSAPAHTELSVVYLHGFSADRHELSPVPERVAAALGANLFFTRLTGHGQDGEAMASASALDWLQDTEEALTVGSRLGGKVVLIGTSTGGTLAVWGAAQGRWRGRIAALVLVSPNLGVRDTNAEMLLWPWGGLLARAALGRTRCFEALNEEQARHWTTCYPTPALLPMMALVDHVRGLDVAGIDVPLLVLYSRDDRVVDPGATERLFASWKGEPRELVEVAGSDDPSAHLLAGDIASASSTDGVVDTILSFLRSLPTPNREGPP